MTPQIEAHRGDKTNAPENTMSAFKCALDLSVPWIELDVHPAKDGTLVVVHDDTVDRTTDGFGAVFDMTVDEIRGLDAGRKFSAEFAGERIPLLIDVLRLVDSTDVLLNVEIKMSPAGVDVPQTVLDLLYQFGKQKEYLVSSFDLQALLQVQSKDPDVALALIGNGPEILRLAQEHSFSWIHVHHKTVDRQLIEDAHNGGICVNVWTVDEPDQLAFWKDMGADKICTNQPAVMLAAAKNIQ